MSLSSFGRKMLLHRHASAGERLASASPDRMRGLDDVGREDAARLTQTLTAHLIERVVSSPYPRCLESVAPLARARRLVVEPREELAPDSPLESVEDFLHDLADDVLVCTHREIFERLFGRGAYCEKAGTWIVERRGSLLVPTAYLPPPSGDRQRRLAVSARVR